ncbi:MAG: LysM peptidoglycan-binding domain-containing protein [Luteolibacter sp.]
MFSHTTFRSFQWLLPAVSTALLLGSCANQDGFASNDPYGTGPFDADGNYREDWADDPTKWRRPGSRQEPLFAANDQPPANATPLPPARPNAYSAPKPKPKPKPKPQPVRYTVKQGDSLYVIARRNATPGAALPRANGISGSLIHPGLRLVIPKNPGGGQDARATRRAWTSWEKTCSSSPRPVRGKPINSATG